MAATVHLCSLDAFDHGLRVEGTLMASWGWLFVAQLALALLYLIARSTLQQ